MHLLKAASAGVVAAASTFTGYGVDQQWRWIYVPIAVAAGLTAFNATYFVPYAPEPAAKAPAVPPAAG